MKLQVRLFILACAAFMLLVSFKILEPEIWRGKKSSAEDVGEGISMDVAINNFKEKYKLDWRFQLKESPWTIAARWVGWRQIHPELTPEMGAVMREMATRPIVSADVGYKGTQLKLSLVLKGGQVVAFKPRWYSRDHIITGRPYAGGDRHNAEIAAFHLGRLLEFRRTPLAVGRRINLKKEIMPVASPELLATFFKKDGNTCFYGKCYYCKGKEDGVCGEGEVLEGTIVLWLPNQWTMKSAKHPWSRTYRENKPAKWETDDDYCSKVQMIQVYQTGQRLLDLIDTSIFDYLIGNADRHHYEYFLGNNSDAMVLILDNAKSFGNPEMEERSILAPLYQCCRFRFSTWQKLLSLQDGILSKVLRDLLIQDPIAPILTEAHLLAMDKRLNTVLLEMEKCVAKNGFNGVYMDDT